MYFESIRSNREHFDAILNAIEKLKQSGALPVFLDLAARKIEVVPSANPVENMALVGMFAAGYREAVYDMFFFRERLSEERNVGAPRVDADFGAIDTLLNKNLISKDEAAAMKGNRR